MTVVQRVTAKSRRSVDPITSTPTLVTSAVQAVRESIYDGRLGPGARLVEADLAQQLGISRGPLREALHLLGKEGLVVTIPRHSKFVQNVDSRSVDEVYSLRKILEAYAVERAAEVNPETAPWKRFRLERVLDARAESRARSGAAADHFRR